MSAGFSCCCPVQLEEVVDGADHCPLGSDVVETAEEELAEASGLLDLSEHRLDDLLAQPVSRSPSGPADRVGHCLHPWLALQHTPRCELGLPVPDGKDPPEQFLG